MYSFFSDFKIQYYDASLRDIKDFFVDELKILLLDSDILVKLTLLKEIPQFFVFLGRQLANDVLLSHIITYLNDPSWELRWYETLLIPSAFLETVVSISTSLGSKELEEYVLPLIMMSIFGKLL
jgi:phosphoinositide-3-kinase regulatory subunit 4